MKFHFKPINVFAMKKAIKNMDSSKAFQIDNIPPKILKQNDDICSGVLPVNLNRSIAREYFLTI